MAVTIQVSEQWIEKIIEDWQKYFPVEANAFWKEFRIIQNAIKYEGKGGFAKDGEAIMRWGYTLPTRLRDVFEYYEPGFVERLKKSTTIKKYFGIPVRKPAKVVMQ